MVSQIQRIKNRSEKYGIMPKWLIKDTGILSLPVRNMIIEQVGVASIMARMTMILGDAIFDEEVFTPMLMEAIYEEEKQHARKNSRS